MKRKIYIIIILFTLIIGIYFMQRTYIYINCKIATTSKEISECIWNRKQSDIDKIVYYRSKQHYLKTGEELKHYYSLVSLDNIHLNKYKTSFVQDKEFIEIQSKKCFREDIECFNLYFALNSEKLSNTEKVNLYENQLKIYGICDKGPLFSLTDLYITYKNLVEVNNLLNKFKIKEIECEDNQKKEIQRYEEWNAKKLKIKSLINIFT